MILALGIGAALAGGRGVMVNVVDADGLLDAAGVVVTYTPAGAATVTAALENDGAPPDTEAGDAVWAGRLDNVAGDAGRVTLRSGARTFAADVVLHGGGTPSMSLRPAADGTLLDVDGIALSDLAPMATSQQSGTATWNNMKLPLDAGPGGVGPSEVGRSGGAPPVTGAWIRCALVALALGGAFAWLRQVASPVPPGAPLGRPATAPPVRVPFDTDPAAHIAGLPVGTRTVYAGPALAVEPPRGTVWWVGPGRPVVEDLLALVRHLGERGAFVVVVIAGPVEGAGGRRGADAVDHLFSRLPPGSALHEPRA